MKTEFSFEAFYEQTLNRMLEDAQRQREFQKAPLDRDIFSKARYEKAGMPLAELALREEIELLKFGVFSAIVKELYLLHIEVTRLRGLVQPAGESSHFDRNPALTQVPPVLPEPLEKSV